MRMGSCDLIMAVYNELEITKNCLESLIKNTVFPYRLIIIDNGSEEPTKNYLIEMKNKFSHFTLIRFEKNLGFVKAINTGLKNVDAEFICLVNNDTIFTKGWLSEMVEIMRENKEIGVLNPASNSWSEWPPKNNSLEEYAEKISLRKGQWQEASYCIGFCMMFRKDILDKVGYLDDSYGMGYLEETDFCRRVQKLNYFCGIAKGAYVYHLGGQTFKKFSNSRVWYKENLKIFNQRWGKSLRMAFIIGGKNIDKEKTHQLVLSALRDYHAVRVYSPILLDKTWVPNHAGLRLYEIESKFFTLKVFLRIFLRQLKQGKEKNFHIIILLNCPLAFLFKGLLIFPKLLILINPSLTEARLCWQRISQF